MIYANDEHDGDWYEVSWLEKLTQKLQRMYLSNFVVV